MKVFSREKYLSNMDEIAPNGAEVRRGYVWPSQCDGKTEEECNELGGVVFDSWMEDKII